MFSRRAKLALAALVLVIAPVALSAWTGPSGAAPDANVFAPLNIGSTDQVKNAGLSVNSLAVFGNALLSGTSRYLNFGSTSGSTGYGLRDPACLAPVPMGTASMAFPRTAWES